MKKFLLTVLAVIVGGIILSILPFLIMVGVASSIGKEEVAVKSNSALVYNIETNVMDQEEEDPMAVLTQRMYGNTGSMIGFRTLLDNIDKAAVDENIKCIVLEGSSSGASLTDIREIRNHLISFKEKGKKVYYYSNSIEPGALYLASVADKLCMTPEGMVTIMGMSSSIMFYKDILDKFDVEMQVIRHGKFKSAIEPYILNGMSEANKEQTQKFIDSMWATMREDIATARGIKPEVIDSYINEFQFSDPKNAVDLGLIDQLMYRDEFISMVKQDLGIDEKDNIASVGIEKYKNAMVYRPEKSFATRKIALITASGEIFDGSNEMDNANIYGDDLSRAIREARRDESVEAIVLRVNSPGGSALASDIIWREVKLAKEAKPVIVSMGQYAASGGYYISCAADYIYAQPNTLTGSIGVFGLIPCVKKAINKWGIHVDVTSSHEVTPPSLYEPLSAKQKAFYQNMVEKTYDVFTSRCAEGRHCTQEHIDSIGQGRVWAGMDALQIGLVDELGSLDDAIAMAKSKVGIEGEANIVVFPTPQDPVKKMLKQMGMDTKATIGKAVLGDAYEYAKKAQALTKEPSVQARMDADITLVY